MSQSPHEQLNESGHFSPTGLPQHLAHTAESAEQQPFSLSQIVAQNGHDAPVSPMPRAEKGPVMRLQEDGTYGLGGMQFATETTPDLSAARLEALMQNPNMLAIAKQYLDTLSESGQMPAPTPFHTQVPKTELDPKDVDLEAVLAERDHGIDPQQIGSQVDMAKKGLATYEEDFGQAKLHLGQLLEEQLRTVGALVVGIHELENAYDRTKQNHDTLRGGIDGHFTALCEQFDECERLLDQRGLLVAGVRHFQKTERGLDMTLDRTDAKLARAIKEQEEMLARHRRIRERLVEFRRRGEIKPDDLKLLQLTDYAPEHLKERLTADFHSAVQGRPTSTAAQGIREHMSVVGEILTRGQPGDEPELDKRESAVTTYIEQLNSAISTKKLELDHIVAQRDKIARDIAEFDDTQYNPALSKLEQLDRELAEMLALARTRGRFAMKSIPRQIEDARALQQQQLREQLLSADRVSDPHRQLEAAPQRPMQPETRSERRQLQERGGWLGRVIRIGKKN